MITLVGQLVINSVHQLLLLRLVHKKSNDILKPQFPGLGKKFIMVIEL